MPRTLEDIHRESPDSPVLRGLVSVLNDKLQLRARYDLLEYEAGMEGRWECEALFRELSRTESEQITRLGSTLTSELRSQDPDR